MKCRKGIGGNGEAIQPYFPVGLSQQTRPASMFRSLYGLIVFQESSGVIRIQLISHNRRLGKGDTDMGRSVMEIQTSFSPMDIRYREPSRLQGGTDVQRQTQAPGSEHGSATFSTEGMVGGEPPQPSSADAEKAAAVAVDTQQGSSNPSGLDNAGPPPADARSEQKAATVAASGKEKVAKSTGVPEKAKKTKKKATMRRSGAPTRRVSKKKSR